MFLPPRHRRYCRVACAVVAVVVVSVVRIARVCNCLQCLMFEENMTDVISCAFITSCKYYAVLWIIALKIWIVYIVWIYWLARIDTFFRPKNAAQRYTREKRQFVRLIGKEKMASHDETKPSRVTQWQKKCHIFAIPYTLIIIEKG